MRRDTAGAWLRRWRPAASPAVGVPAARAALLATGLAVVLAGCGSHGGTGRGAAGASPAATGSQHQASSGKDGSNPLASSRLKVLTTLSQAQLCAALSTSQVTQILGSAPQAPVYGRSPGLGIYCRWPKRGTARPSPDELYVGISSVTDWGRAQEVDKLLQATSVLVDGRAALTAGPLPAMQWAQVDVALGGTGDPVAEYRAPTRAEALAMARAATPHILAMG